MPKGLEKRVRCTVACNSGAKSIQIFGFYNNHRVARVGDIVKGSIKSAQPGTKVKKKEVYKMLVVRSNQKHKINGLYHARFFQNSVILLNDKHETIGTSMSGITSYTLDNKQRNRIRAKDKIKYCPKFKGVC